jgi:protein-L-isoaspartate(D-aspartate) O-methyltransferase
MRTPVNEQNFEVMRRSMVASQLRTNAVSNPQIVAAMEAVAREDFVPDDRRALAYVDVAIPIGKGRALNAPMATGRLLNEAGVRPTDSVLIIGAATGYAAAVVAQLAARVVALEEDDTLSAKAVGLLAIYGNVTLVAGALNIGWPGAAPYDVILIDGAVENVPQTIISQLADDGRLATGLIEDGVCRLAVGRRGGVGFGLTSFVDAETAVLPGFSAPPTFSF